MKRACVALLCLAGCSPSEDTASSSSSSGPATVGAGGGTTSSSASTGTGGGTIGVPCDVENTQHPTRPDLVGLADNTALDLGDFPCTVPDGDGYACQQVTDYSGLVYDCKHHQLLMFGGGHATTFTDTVFAFDITRATWSELYAPTPCTSEYMQMSNFDGTLAAWLSGPSGPYPRPMSRHTYDLLIYDDVLDEFMVLLGPNGDSSSCPPDSTGYTYSNLHGRTSHYGVTAGTWSFSDTAGGDGHPEYDGGEYPAAERDPTSGQTVMLGRNGLYVYDAVTRTKTVAIDNYNESNFTGELGYANHLVYFPPNDRFYYFDRVAGGVWEVAFDRQNPASSIVTEVATSGTPPPHYEPGYAYDAEHQIIGGAVFDSVFYAFDPATSSWSSSSIQGDPGTAAFHAVAYDPVNGVFLFVTESRRTWAYRFAP